MKVLIACEESQEVCKSFRSKGHEAFSCDIQECSGGRPEWHLKCDIREIIYLDWDMRICFPPCFDLCSSGARWFEEKRRSGAQQQSIKFFMLFADFIEKKVGKTVIENPIGIMSSQYKKPDQIIQPFQFGHPETKSTCLWLGNLPKLIPTKIIEPDFMKKPNGEYYKDKKGKRYSRIHFMSRNNPNRAKDRSKTFPGIAQAMADQWG